MSTLTLDGMPRAADTNSHVFFFFFSNQNQPIGLTKKPVSPQRGPLTKFEWKSLWIRTLGIAYCAKTGKNALETILSNAQSLKLYG